jgi:hypothetical protein
MYEIRDAIRFKDALGDGQLYERLRPVDRCHLSPNVEVCGAASRAAKEAMPLSPRPATPPC